MFFSDFLLKSNFKSLKIWPSSTSLLISELLVTTAYLWSLSIRSYPMRNTESKVCVWMWFLRYVKKARISSNKDLLKTMTLHRTGAKAQRRLDPGPFHSLVGMQGPAGPSGGGCRSVRADLPMCTSVATASSMIIWKICLKKRKTFPNQTSQLIWTFNHYSCEWDLFAPLLWGCSFM